MLGTAAPQPHHQQAPATRARLAVAGLALALTLLLPLAASPTPLSGAPAAAITPTAVGGDTPAAIRGAVDAFRSALGPDNGNGGTLPSGRREISWDNVPDALSAPNTLPANYYNTTSPRGVTFSTAGTGFQVSAAPTTSVPPRFGNLHPSYTALFHTFASQRLFTALGSTRLDVYFFVPGTNSPATVSAFGAVFSDVDDPNTSGLEFYDAQGNLLGEALAPPGAQSFAAGQVDGPGPRIARVRIRTGNAALGPRNTPSAVDVVALSHLVYGEPQRSAQITAAPSVTPTPMTVPLNPRPAPPASATPACTSGTTLTVTGGVSGVLRCGSYTFTLTATGPAGTQVGGTPAVFVQAVTPGAGGVPVTDAVACTQPVPPSLTVTCTGSSPNFPARGGLVTVRFPLVGGGTADVTGVIGGAPGGGVGGSVGVILPGPPVPPLPLLPPPPLLVPPPPAALPVAPEVPVIPEADSLALLGLGLAVLGGLAGLRRRRAGRLAGARARRRPGAALRRAS